MKSSRGVEIHSFRQNSERCQRRSNSSGCAAIPFRNGCSGVSMPTSYVGPRGHTEENKRTAQGQGSQHSISSRHTLQTANSGGCARSTIKSSAERVPRCSDENKDSRRKNGTSGDRPPTTYRRLRHGRSALMQGLASRENHLNSRNDNRRAMQGSCMAGLSHLSHPVTRLGRTCDSENAI